MRTPTFFVAAAGAATVVAGTAVPSVAAAPPTIERWTTTETSATVSWVEQDPDDSSGRPGTVHVGGLFVDHAAGNTDVFAGAMADWDCEPGALPGDAGDGCSLVGAYEASSADLHLAFDRRAGAATVRGTVTFYDPNGVEDVWTAPVDLRWTAEGEAVRTRTWTNQVSESARTVSRTRTLTWETVVVRGSVGSMVLGDEPGELDEERLWETETRHLRVTRPGDEPPSDDPGNGGGQG